MAKVSIIVVIRKKIYKVLSEILYKRAIKNYHKWYYYSGVWKTTYFLGINTMKSVSDMWNYQEIIFNLKPSLIIEFGTNWGRSSHFLFSNIK